MRNDRRSSARWLSAVVMLAVVAFGGCTYRLPPPAAPAAPAEPAIALESLQPEGAYSPLAPESVRAERMDVLPANLVRLARVEMRQPGGEPDSALVNRIRSRAARRGGTLVAWRILRPGVVEYTLARDPVLAAALDRRMAAQRDSAARGLGTDGSGGPHGGSSAGGGVSGGGCSGSCSVHVRGYTRKDGTYVRPHTRSAPRRGGRRR
jgi:uncharacterized membrane protein YgcG